MSGLWRFNRRLADTLDRISVRIGQIASYATLACIAVIAVSVILRYFFNRTYVALDEIQYYCYSIVFLYGFAYVYQQDGHIRVDIINSRLSDKKRHWIDLLGALLLTIPWSAAVCFYSWQYFLRSFKIRERSTEATGLPALYILKFILFLAFILLLFQAVSAVVRRWGLIRGRLEK
ncbi:MAG: TRAP transporter small permease subunit [Desulfobacteraceae bacterium]|nr:TRAP transporter small permease subunit [Desulfobacteraceae bacterium]